MFAVISRKCFIDDIEKAVTQYGYEISYSVVNSDLDIISESTKLLRLKFNYLILDISSVMNPENIPQAIRKIRILNDAARIIIIAPNAAPGDAILSQLVTMGVYDILNPCFENDGDYDISDQLLNLLNRKPSYSQAVKWDVGAGTAKVLPENKSSADKVSEKNEVITVIKEKIIGTVTIAVAGITHGIGCTHNAIATAYYLSKFDDTALLEMNDSGDILSLDVMNSPALLPGSFELNGVDFYGRGASLSDIIALNTYKYIVLDIGPLAHYAAPGKVDFNKYYEEFIRASLSVLVCGSKPWHSKYLKTCIQSFSVDGRSLPWLLAYNFTDTDDFKYIAKHSELSSYLVPYFSDMFSEDPAVGSFLANILSDVIPATNTKKKRRRLFG